VRVLERLQGYLALICLLQCHLLWLVLHVLGWAPVERVGQTTDAPPSTRYAARSCWKGADPTQRDTSDSRSDSVVATLSLPVWRIGNSSLLCEL